MLPHFPALLLLLVSSGGSDFSPSPPPPWKAPSTSHPSPKQPPAGRPEPGRGPDTLTPSPPEIKVRHEVLLDVAGHLLRPSGGHHEDSPASRPGVPRGSHGGLAGQGSFILQLDRMVSLPASALSSGKLNTPSLPASPRPLESSSPGGGVNTWVISAVSGKQQPGQDNHHLTQQKPSPSIAVGYLHHDDHTNANQLISHTWRSASLPHPLTEPGHHDSLAPHVNLRHNNFLSSSSRDSNHPSSLTRPSGKHSLIETKLSTLTGSSSEAKLGHSATAASTRPQKVSQDDDSLAADADTSRGTADVHTRDTRTGDDHTAPGHTSKATVQTTHAVHLKHETWRDDREEGEDIDFPEGSPIILHTKPPLSTELPQHNTHALSLPMSNETDSTLMTKKNSLNYIPRSGRNSEVYVADALLSKTWRRGSEDLAQEAPPTALPAALAAEDGQKKAKNSLFRVGRADRGVGREGGRPGVLFHQREKREAEGTRKNEFVVVDAGANEGQLDMAAGQGQGGGGGGEAAFWEMRKTAVAECRETAGNCAAENHRQKTQKLGRIRSLPASPANKDILGVLPRAGERTWRRVQWWVGRRE
ncbi:uncharacterized protein LOC123513494 [Portunus trituberculatus]|uniref:uncharacterized protein LOC123513494 n=1 Tax=Portunus trituberculatus TaxID=210409 RepID=UPI001E1D193B|nr:uncharacterized protein LOC123513494 [Portunus trituberculatus]XP_045126626.1 uncharacterized protein LOC123513494 [Portunus trituberculatus]